MSKSQNNMSGRPSYPPCAKYCKNHSGGCFMGQKSCMVVGKLGHGIRKYPHAK